MNVNKYNLESKTNHSFSAYLKSVRRTNDWTAKELAERMGRKKGYMQFIYDVEHREAKPSGPFIRDLSKALNVKPQYLLDIAVAEYKCKLLKKMKI